MAPSNTIQNSVYIDIIDRLKSKGGIKRTVKKMDDLGKAIVKSEKESSKRQLNMEKAAMAGEKAVNKEITKRKQQQKSISDVSARQNTFDKIQKKYGLTQAHASKAMSTAGLRMQKNGTITNLAGKRVKNYGKQLRQGAVESKRFNMNALGVMFAGMALNRTFASLNATSREWVGMNELMSTMMGVVTLPATMDLLTFGVLPLFDALTNLPEPAQYAIGTVTTALEGLGGVMMVGGQLMLGVGSTIGVLEKLGGGAGLIAGAVAALKILGGIGLVTVGITLGIGSILAEGGTSVIYAIGSALAIALGAVLLGASLTTGIIIGGIALTLIGVVKMIIKDIKYEKDLQERMEAGLYSTATPFEQVSRGFSPTGGQGTMVNFVAPGFDSNIPSMSDMANVPSGFENNNTGTTPPIVISPTYNVKVADKYEFERMLEDNNGKITADVRRIVQT